MESGNDIVPDGWIATTIASVIFPRREKIKPNQAPNLRFIGMDSIQPGEMKISAVSKFAKMKSDAFHFFPGDVLYGRLRPYLNKVYKAEFEGACSSEFIVFPAISCIDSNYIKYLLHNKELVNFTSHLTTGDRPRIDFKQLSQYKFTLPPLNEQRRIVDKIEQLFSNIDEGESLLKKAQQQLNIYRQSVLKAAVTGELTGCNYNTWKEYSIGQLLTDIRYGTAKKCFFDPLKTPVLRIPNVAGGKIDLSDLKHTDFTQDELHKLRLEKGDILLVRSNGSASLVGLSAIVTESATGFAYAGYLIRLRIKNDLILPEFLNCYLHSPLARSRIEREARSTSGVHNINSNEVRSITLRLPSLQEQENIVNSVDLMFSQIDTLEQWCASELTRSATLRQSILKDAFSGRLVPQDPNDEPASELLKRIQAEQSVDNKAPKKKSPSTTPTRRGRPRKNKLS